MSKIFETEKEIAKKTTTKITSTIENHFQEEQDIIVIEAEKFKDRDLKFYAKKKIEGEKIGYRYVGDTENCTLSKANPSMRTFTRNLISQDGETVMSIFHATPRGILGLFFIGKLKCIDFVTEFENGVFVLTSNTPEVPFQPPTKIKVKKYPDIKDAAELEDLHKQHVREYEEKNSIKKVRFYTIEDVIEMSKRQMKIAHDFRKGNNFALSGEEMDGFLKGKNDRVYNKMREEMKIQEGTVTYKEKLESEGYFKYCSPEVKEKLKFIKLEQGEIPHTEYNDEFVPEDYRFHMLDGEELFEIGGIIDYLNQVKKSFEKMGLKMDIGEDVEVENDGYFWEHRITVNGKEYIAYKGKLSDNNAWGIAAKRFAEIINDQLKLQGSDERAYLISGGNDGFLIFLTDELFDIIRNSSEDNTYLMTIEEWSRYNKIQ